MQGGGWKWELGEILWPIVVWWQASTCPAKLGIKQFFEAYQKRWWIKFSSITQRFNLIQGSSLVIGASYLVTVNLFCIFLSDTSGIMVLNIASTSMTLMFVKSSNKNCYHRLSEFSCPNISLMFNHSLCWMAKERKSWGAFSTTIYVP